MKRSVILLTLLAGLGGAIAATPTPESDQFTRVAALTTSAQGGDVAAQLALANHYDPRQAPAEPRTSQLQTAITWYLRAALQGSVEAQTQLAELYAAAGKNPVMAYAWFSIAQQHHLSDSAVAEFNRIKGTMSPEQQAKARRFASELLARHPSITHWK